MDSPDSPLLKDPIHFTYIAHIFRSPSAFRDSLASLVRKAMVRKLRNRNFVSAASASKIIEASRGKVYALTKKHRAFPLQDLVRLPG